MHVVPGPANVPRQVVERETVQLPCKQHAPVTHGEGVHVGVLGRNTPSTHVVAVVRLQPEEVQHAAVINAHGFGVHVPPAVKEKAHR